jgi:hypothetical protein
MRVPRPTGTTELGKRFHITNDEEHYKELIQTIIHHYIRNHFSYCTIPMNIEMFSMYIGINTNDVKRQFTSYGKEISKLSKEMVNGDLLRVLTGMSIFQVSEDRSAIQQQVALLLRSQNNEYKPFISGEVNRALNLMLGSTAQLTNLLKTFSSNGNGSMLPITPFEDNENNIDKGITADQFVRLLKEQNVTPLMEDDNQKALLYKQYQLSEMPNVDALTQVGIDTSKEGLTINDISVLDNDILAKELKEDKKTKHNNRRAKELNIDIENHLD